jgi:hypothetical protein
LKLGRDTAVENNGSPLSKSFLDPNICRGTGPGGGHW